jgi:hypothetical protein
MSASRLQQDMQHQCSFSDFRRNWDGSDDRMWAFGLRTQAKSKIFSLHVVSPLSPIY